MKNILFVTSEYSYSTGGTKYDRIFIETLKENKDLNITVLQDTDFTNQKLNWKEFAKVYSKKVKMFSEFDYFITNSRLYTRLHSVIDKIKSKKTKILVFHHHYNFLTHSGLKQSIHKYLEVGFLKKCDTIILASPYVLDLSEKILPKVDKRLFTCPPSSTVINELHRSDSTDIVFVGNIEARKGVQYLIEAARELKFAGLKFTVNIVGNTKYDIAYSEMIINLIEKYNLRDYVKLLGRIDEDEKNRIYRDGCLFAFPSLHEGFGIVLLEAMSYGLPVVSFNNSALPYTVKNNVNGLLVENENKMQFSNAIKKLLIDRELNERLSQGAIETAKNAVTLRQHKNAIAEFANELL